MKKGKYFRSSLLLPVITLLLFAASSCNEDEDEPTVVFQATLNGTNEVPPNGSTSTGVATLTYDTLAKKFDVVVTYNGVAATGAHIHKGAPGVAGGVIFGFPNPVTSPISYTSPVLDAAQEADLYSGQYYVNIHSAAYPNGEIRGQLIKQP